MLSPDWISGAADDIVALYEQYQTSLVEDIARRIARIGVSDASVWQVMAYQEAGGVFDDAMKQIAATSGASERELAKAFYEAGALVLDVPSEIIAAQGKPAVTLAQSPAIRQVLEAGLAQTGGLMHNLTLTTAVTSQSAFIEAANLAYAQVAFGGMSYTEAISRAVWSIADDGLYVLYPTGHRDKVDVAMRRAVLTGVNQTAGKMSEMNLRALGAEYVETTAHMGARPSHTPWQGRVFHWGGAKGKYPDFVSSTGYRTGAGLCGWNCRHNFFPFFPGLSERAYSDGELERMKNATVMYGGQEIPMYKATQMQRAMERDIRASKRELLALDTAGKTGDGAMDEAMRRKYEEAARKLRRQRDRLRDFSEQSGLLPQPEREQVTGFGRSAAQRAVGASRKAAQVVSSSEAAYRALIGVSTADGRVVRGLAEHFSRRAATRNISVENALNALQNALDIGKIKIDNYGRKSMYYIGEHASVAYNPETDTLVTVHGTHQKLLRKLLKGRSGE